jgi:hypothetical protein
MVTIKFMVTARKDGKKVDRERISINQEKSSQRGDSGKAG